MVEIGNKRLKNFIENIFNKSISNISYSDLRKVKQLSFIGEMNNIHIIDFSDLDLFDNVEAITITDSLLTDENIDLISKHNIKSLTLYRCSLNNEKALSKLVSLVDLEIVNSYITNYDFLINLNNLKQLIISNSRIKSKVNVSYLSNMSKLENLTLQECDISNLEKLINCRNIKNLNILWSNIPNNVVDILNNLTNLERLFITENTDLMGLNPNVDVKYDLREFTFEQDEERKNSK